MAGNEFAGISRIFGHDIVMETYLDVSFGTTLVLG